MTHGPESTSKTLASSAAPGAVTGTIDKTDLRQKIILALKSVYDPEIPVDIWELGLVYEIQISEAANVKIIMTLTSPACPVAGSLPVDVEARVNAIDGVSNVEVEIAWDPSWNPEMMSPAAKLELGF